MLKFLTASFLMLSVLNINILCQSNANVEDDLKKDPLHKLQYNRYLKEVVSVLESDPGFRKILENASVDDIKSGKIASHFDMVSHSVRTQLDELKRKEVERLTTLIARKTKLMQVKPHEVQNLLPKHIDHNNSPFSASDLEKLIRQASSDLESLDEQRKENFKEHEVQKEFERKQKLEKLNAFERKKAEEEYLKDIEAQKHHPKINHPGSEDQLEEVWEQQDGLKDEEFDPKTFFKLHDTNDDGLWDEFEIEALFQIELDKIYNVSDKAFDPVEREEEMNRMREHVMSEIDKDKDRMVSLQEFIAATQQKEFDKNEEWKTVEDEPQFDAQDLENYAKLHDPLQSSTLKPDH